MKVIHDFSDMMNEFDRNTINTIAMAEQVVLTEQHLMIINSLQDFYQEFKLVPSTRALINYIKNKNPKMKLDSLLFAKLFPKGIAQACKIANLPASPRCL